MTFVDISDENPKDTPKTSSGPSNTTKDPNESQWGYDLYPERKQNASKTAQSVSEFLAGKGKDNLKRIKCERSVYRCFKESPIVKLMVGALKASGCPIDIRRHISCEECAPNVSGGYDPVLNQVIICHNNAYKEGMVQGVLTHELIHMFDYCKNNLDFKNIDHLACTEIRAANLAHCSFVSAWLNGDTSIFNFKETHQNCVKSKALSSMLAVRDITKLQAIDAIERVFSKCYQDLEPIGRRIRRNSMDMYKAYDEGYFFGYDDPS